MATLEARTRPPTATSETGGGWRARARSWYGMTWKLQFSTVKLDACDELLLAAYTPEGVHLFRHDGMAGLSTAGKSTAATGKQIVFVGPRNEPDWRVALREILEKMEAKGCRRRACVQWEE